MAATTADKPASVPTATNPSTDSNPNDPAGKPDLSTNDVSPPAVSNTEDSLDDSKPSVVSASSAAGDSAAPASNIQKKMKRAERFGMPVQLSEEEKRNCRAERFGTAQVSNGSEAHKHSEELKRKARAERFGLPVPSTATGAVEDAKKKARLARFASGAKSDPQEEEKRKARGLRFSNPPSGSSSPVNGQGSVEANVVVAGKAGGTS